MMMEGSEGPRQRPVDAGSTAAGATDLQPILVPLDGSPAAAALAVARVAAKLWEAPIHLLHVAGAALSSDALLRAVALAPGDLLGLVLDGAVGPPAETILQIAAQRQSTLIVMSTLGGTADVDRPLGHVAEAVLRGARCPLLMVGLEAGKRFATEHRSLTRVLVPLDGTPAAAAALRLIAPLLAPSGATLDVLHVVQPDHAAAVNAGALAVPRYLDQAQHEWQTWRREFRRCFLSALAERPASLRVGVGDPGYEVVRAARERDSDLIVLAWKGNLAPGRAETVHTVLCTAPCPVLLLPIQTGDAVEQS
jgi:nucleotide-binding universal stress UspA family protein